MRQLNYGKAINEALFQAMELDPSVIVAGQTVDTKAGVFGTTTGLVERFGTDRVQDFPDAESVMTVAAVGEALAGLRPVLVHQRMDFMLYSLDAFGNWMSMWRFLSNGQANLPVTIRVVVGKGWGQGPHHSKSIHAWLAHLPGIRVAMPATAFDAKGLLLESIFGEDPTLIVEHRSLFSMEDGVPEKPYRVRFGHAAVRRVGSDVTLAAIGFMVPTVLKAASRLAEESIDVEVIDLRTISPIDKKTLLTSVSKTKRLVVADPAWQYFGAAAEIVTQVCENLGSDLAANPVRVCFPDSHTPVSSALEQEYYPNDETIVSEVRKMLKC